MGQVFTIKPDEPCPICGEIPELVKVEKSLVHLCQGPALRALKAACGWNGPTKKPPVMGADG